LKPTDSTIYIRPCFILSFL